MMNNMSDWERRDSEMRMSVEREMGESRVEREIETRKIQQQKAEDRIHQIFERVKELEAENQELRRQLALR